MDDRLLNAAARRLARVLDDARADITRRRGTATAYAIRGRVSRNGTGVEADASASTRYDRARLNGGPDKE